MVKKLIEFFPHEVKFICEVPFKKINLKHALIAFCVYSPDDFFKMRKGILEKISKENKIDFFRMKKFNHKELFERLNKHNPDVIISNQPYLLKRSILDLPRYGCWNKHFGKLPEFRGAFPFIHQNLQGKNSLNASLYIMDEKLDCGQLISGVEMGKDLHGSFSYNLKRLNKLVVDEIVKAINNYKSGNEITLTKIKDEFAPYRTPTIREIIRFIKLWAKQ